MTEMSKKKNYNRKQMVNKLLILETTIIFVVEKNFSKHLNISLENTKKKKN